MAKFNARFDMEDVMFIDDGVYEIVARVVDNSGNFSLYDVEEGNIIYVYDPAMNTTNRYSVDSITLRKAGRITLTAVWDIKDPDLVPEDPSLSGEAIIGARNTRTNMIEMTSSSLNVISETLQTAVNNFQQDMIADLVDTKEDKLEAPENNGQGVLSINEAGEKSWVEVYTKQETNEMLSVSTLKEFD